MRRIVLAAALAAVGMYGCSESNQGNNGTGGGSGSSGTGGSGGTVAPFSPTFAEHACDDLPIPEPLTSADFRCGTLTTLLNRADPGGQTVDIETAVLLASSEAPEPDPVLFFGGGPGIYNLDNYLPAQAVSVWGPVRETRDVVFFDPRGSGRSRPQLACPDFEATLIDAYSENQSGSEDGINGWLEGYRQCYEQLTAAGIETSYHDSASVAQDAAELMEALGYESYNVYGLSYGGRFVQVMMRDRPESIRSAVLDSTILVEESFGNAWGPNAQLAFDELFSACAASDTCSGTYPDLEEDFEAAAANLNAEPLIVQGTSSGGVEYPLTMTGDRFLVTLHGSLYQTNLVRLLPASIAQGAARNQTIVQAFGTGLGPNEDTRDLGHYASVLCAEELIFDTPESLEAANQGVKQEIIDSVVGSNGTYFIELCDFWQVEPRPEIETQPVQSDIPSLVLSGQFDPATPPPYGEQAAANLANSQYFLFPGFGHGVLRQASAEGEEPRCAQRILVDFLADPSSPVDGSCTSELPSVL